MSEPIALPERLFQFIYERPRDAGGKSSPDEPAQGLSEV
jgi:hypothetical protein